MPLVTVIVVNFNSGSLLERCLRALAAQTFRDFETVVLDNASSDQSARYAAEAADPSIRLIRSKSNLGFAAGNNLAVGAAMTSEWLALLNPDAFPEPGWLAALLRAARDHPTYSMFGSCLIMDADRARLDGMGDVYHVSGLHWRRGHGSVMQSECQTTREIFAPCAAAAMYRRRAFEEVGGFDERYFCYCEDVDLGFRLRLLGHSALYVPDAKVHHVGSGTTGRRSDFAVYYGHRNLVWTYVKNMPRGLFWRYLPYHILLNVGTLVILALRGQGSIAVRAKLDSVKGLPAMVRTRRAVQSRRCVPSNVLLGVMARGWPVRD